MSIIESIQVAMEAILANRMRSALTMLGIIFGVGAVIAAVSMTKGAAEASMERWEQIGTNKLTIMPGQMMRGPVRAGNVETLTVGDAEAIEELVSKIETVAPMKRSSMQVKAGNQNTNTNTHGANRNSCGYTGDNQNQDAFGGTTGNTTGNATGNTPTNY